MNDKEITTERIDELLAFLPLFEKKGAKFIDGWIQNAYPRYTSEVNRFFDLVAQPCWKAPNYVGSAASKKLDDFDFIRSASMEEIKTMLTATLRSERFSDGSWLWFLNNGTIQAILRRLEALKNIGNNPAK